MPMNLNSEDMGSMLPSNMPPLSDSGDNEGHLSHPDHPDNIDGDPMLRLAMASRHHPHLPGPAGSLLEHHQRLNGLGAQQQQSGSSGSSLLSSSTPPGTSSGGLCGTGTGSGSESSRSGSAGTRRDHNIDYSSLFIQLTGTFPTLYSCVSCHKTVSNRWHHANIHRPQSHECPVCGQKFTRRDNMKAHCKVKHPELRDRFYNHIVHM
ncbi:hypothetical protein pipiens_001845 [Culex pipiens pipiens]|uniref:C2H2-type domain-containing protein n=1 Tax=Culex pipiens pipiens TaxID=38569 RepID=A0ABD1DW11_CULPP